MRVDQAKQLKDLEKENTQLKRIVADQALDMVILKDVASGKFCARANAGAPFRWPARDTGCPSVVPVRCLGRPAPPSATRSVFERTKGRNVVAVEDFERFIEADTAPPLAEGAP